MSRQKKRKELSDEKKLQRISKELSEEASKRMETYIKNNFTKSLYDTLVSNGTSNQLLDLIDKFQPNTKQKIITALESSLKGNKAKKRS